MTSNCRFDNRVILEKGQRPGIPGRTPCLAMGQRLDYSKLPIDRPPSSVSAVLSQWRAVVCEIIAHMTQLLHTGRRKGCPNYFDRKLTTIGICFVQSLGESSPIYIHRGEAGFSIRLSRFPWNCHGQRHPCLPCVFFQSGRLACLGGESEMNRQGGAVGLRVYVHCPRTMRLNA